MKEMSRRMHGSEKNAIRESKINRTVVKLRDAAEMRGKIAAAGNQITPEQREKLLTQIEEEEKNLKAKIAELGEYAEDFDKLIPGKSFGPEWDAKRRDWLEKATKIETAYEKAKGRINKVALTIGSLGGLAVGSGTAIGIYATMFEQLDRLGFRDHALQNMAEFTIERGIAVGTAGAAIFLAGHAINKGIHKVREWTHNIKGTVALDAEFEKRDKKEGLPSFYDKRH